MGQKLATDTSQWTVNDWAFGTAQNAVPMEDVVDEVRQMPMKYFGGNAIQNDTSMQQMQNDLLSFDDQLKRLFFWRKKNKRSKRGNYSEQEYYEENDQSYDQSHQTIPEEDEPIPPLPPIYVERNDQLTNKNPSWKCDKCGKQNQSTDIECLQCKKDSERL
jgi:hypothetical protein